MDPQSNHLKYELNNISNLCHRQGLKSKFYNTFVSVFSPFFSITIFFGTNSRKLADDRWQKRKICSKVWSMCTTFRFKIFNERVFKTGSFWLSGANIHVLAKDSNVPLNLWFIYTGIVNGTYSGSSCWVSYTGLHIFKVWFKSDIIFPNFFW